MTTDKIDFMLRDLEKQVHDFTLQQTLSESQPTAETVLDKKKYYYLQEVPASFLNNTNSDKQEEEEDDDVCIGTILQRSATARKPEKKQPTNLVPHSKSMKYNTNRKRDDNEELKLAMKQALSVTTNDSTNNTSRSVIKTMTTRIYINDGNSHKVVQLTNLLTSAMVIQYLRKKSLLDASEDWTLFEIDIVHNVERPLREWEVVMDVLNVWDVDASNALLVKKYAYHYTLTADSILQKKINPMHSWVSIEYKKGKWQKRFCFVKDNAIYHSKDSKGSNASILCYLASYDVYTLLQPLKISPTPFLFAIRAQDKSSIFERESDYMRFLAVETQEDMENWVLCLRCIKSTIQYNHHPTRVTSPLSPIELPETNSNALRRQKSMKDIKPTPSLSTTKRSLGRSGTTRHRTTSTPEEDHTTTTTTDPSTTTFVKGSLLAKEETPEQILYRQQQQQQHHYHEEPNPNTLIQIEDRVKFSKGSLLAKKEDQIKLARSKSVKETAPDEIRRHQSLKRKNTTKRPQQSHDVPLPNNAAIASIPPSHQLLQQQENGGSRRHHVKPLLSFDDKK